jgi:hypothetical protein
VDKLCPRIVLVHSQSGAYGFQGPRSASRQGQGTSCIEPTLAGDKNKISTLTKRPLLFVIGDNAKEQPRWSKTRSADVEYANALKGAGAASTLSICPTWVSRAIRT